MKFEQLSNCTLPKKRPQLGNPSTKPVHPKGSNYSAASPWSSKFALVPSKTPSILMRITSPFNYTVLDLRIRKG